MFQSMTKAYFFQACEFAGGSQIKPMVLPKANGLKEEVCVGYPTAK